MNNEKFMAQKASDMTIRELLEAIRIKAKQDKYFVDEMSKAMRGIEFRKGLAKQKVFNSPLQNPEILKIVQQLVQMDKEFAAMKRREAEKCLVKKEGSEGQ